MPLTPDPRPRSELHRQRGFACATRRDLTSPAGLHQRDEQELTLHSRSSLPASRSFFRA
jgi:hypothetical protein